MLLTGLILIALSCYKADAMHKANCRSGRYYMNQSVIAIGENLDPSKYDFTADYGASNIRVICIY
jgi:hypothetical protein